MRTELAFSYDEHMRPVGAICRACGAAMPKPDSTLTNPADMVMWFSRMFIEHRQLMHLQSAPSEPTDDLV